MKQKRTIHQVYYAINAAIISYLAENNIKASFYKTGIDPATLKTDRANLQTIRYPYIQSTITNLDPQSWTSKESGIFTDFDYQLSFFTAPQSELENDSKYFYAFEVAKDALSDVNLNLIGDIASIMSTNGPIDFQTKSGQSVPSAVMIYRMRSICAYRAIVEDSGTTTDLNGAIQLQIG